MFIFCEHQSSVGAASHIDVCRTVRGCWCEALAARLREIEDWKAANDTTAWGIDWRYIKEGK